MTQSHLIFGLLAVVTTGRQTIVRPTILTTGPRTGAYRVLVNARDWRSGFISRADVADFRSQDAGLTG